MPVSRAAATGTVVAFAAVLASVAAAAAVPGTAGRDRLTGTPRADVIDGGAGRDLIRGIGGADLLTGGTGRDTILAGPGDDRVVASDDGERDVVDCGAGADVVAADAVDSVAANCETVARRLSTDRTASPAQHATQVEPDDFAWGATVVGVYQVGRYSDGAATAIGFSTSTDAGRTWASGLLPGLTVSSPSPGADVRVSDPAVGYDAAHGVWLAASLGVGASSFELLVSRSADGKAWSSPVVAVTARAQDVDKEWVACDNWQSSPYEGRCYLSYLDVGRRQILTIASTDGGATWTTPVATTPAAARGLDVNGAQILPRPDGSGVVVYASLRSGEGDASDDDVRVASGSLPQEVLAARSTDGGASFAQPVHVADLVFEPVAGLRAPPLPSADVDQGGRLYVTWSGCPTAAGCTGDRLLLSTSEDGVAWTPATEIARASAAVAELLPGLAVDPTSPPAAARLAAVYYTVPRRCSAAGRRCAGAQAWLSRSTDGGTTWRRRLLSAQPVALRWLARTQSGAFFGDYLSTVFASGAPVALVSLAIAPVGSRLRQSIYAVRLPAAP